MNQRRVWRCETKFPSPNPLEGYNKQAQETMRCWRVKITARVVPSGDDVYDRRRALVGRFHKCVQPRTQRETGASESRQKEMQMSGLRDQQISRHTLLVSFDGPQTERRLIRATCVGRPGRGRVSTANESQMAGTERSEGAGREYDVGLEMEGSAINGGELGAYAVC